MTSDNPVSDDSLENLAYETCLERLQEIVGDLEAGRQGLEASLAQFEQGIALYRRCHELLQSAEARVELLTGFSADGQPLTVPYDTASTASEQENTPGRRKSKRSESPRRTTDESSIDESSIDTTVSKPAPAEGPRPRDRGGLFE